MRFAKWLGLLVLFAARDAPAYGGGREPQICDESHLTADVPRPRVAHWATALDPIEVRHVATRANARVRLYAEDGSIDAGACEAFDRIASGYDDPIHPLSTRVEQLVMKAAYHFRGASVLVVSGWRTGAARHGTGEAIDFKLDGVRSSELAAYLRMMPRVGVGVYTHPRTQFVHLDVREPSYHWIDASPPGVRWREAMLRDPRASTLDASWTPQMDLP
jgi:uncharacterized protein YcbK (DUF882 family)